MGRSRPDCKRAIFSRTELEPISTAANVGMGKPHSLHAAGEDRHRGLKMFEGKSAELPRQQTRCAPPTLESQSSTCANVPATSQPALAVSLSLARSRQLLRHAGTLLQSHCAVPPRATIR